MVQNKSRSRPPEKEFHHLKHRKRRTQKKVKLVPFQTRNKNPMTRLNFKNFLKQSETMIARMIARTECVGDNFEMLVTDLIH